MRVKNVPGTGDLECNCESWKQHWWNYSGQALSRLLGTDLECKRIGCSANEGTSAIDGAHIQMVDSGDQKWYIVPLCRECNQSHDEFEIPDNTPLAPADVTKTCGKEQS